MLVGSLVRPSGCPSACLLVLVETRPSVHGPVAVPCHPWLAVPSLFSDTNKCPRFPVRLSSWRGTAFDAAAVAPPPYLLSSPTGHASLLQRLPADGVSFRGITALLVLLANCYFPRGWRRPWPKPDGPESRGPGTAPGGSGADYLDMLMSTLPARSAVSRCRLLACVYPLACGDPVRNPMRATESAARRAPRDPGAAPCGNGEEDSAARPLVISGPRLTVTASLGEDLSRASFPNPFLRSRRDELHAETPVRPPEARREAWLPSASVDEGSRRQVLPLLMQWEMPNRSSLLLSLFLA